jgi:dTMP kinase
VVLPANRAAADGLVPDLTLILDLAPEVGQNRQVVGGKQLDRLEQESVDFHRRVAQFYLAVRGEGVRHLDGRLPPDRLLQAAWSEILKAAPDRFGAVTG